MTVDILSTPMEAAFKAAIPNKLFVINVLTGPVPGGQSVQRNSYDVMKDSQRLLLNSNREVNDVRPTITIVTNWAAGRGNSRLSITAGTRLGVYEVRAVQLAS